MCQFHPHIPPSCVGDSKVHHTIQQVCGLTHTHTHTQVELYDVPFILRIATRMVFVNTAKDTNADQPLIILRTYIDHGTKVSTYFFSSSLFSVL